MKTHSLKTLLVLACGSALALTSSSRAEDAAATPDKSAQCHAGFQRGAHGGEHGELLQKIVEKLNLTDDQKAQIKPIFEATRTQLKTIWDDQSLTKEQKMEKLKEVREATRGHIKGILTAEQQQKLEEMKSNFQARKQNG